MSYRLDVESLSVESFDTSVAPTTPRNDPNDPFAPVDWTGCDSACGATACGGSGFFDCPVVDDTTMGIVIR